MTINSSNLKEIANVAGDYAKKHPAVTFTVLVIACNIGDGIAKGITNGMVAYKPIVEKYLKYAVDKVTSHLPKPAQTILAVEDSIESAYDDHDVEIAA